MSADARLAALGVELPPAPKPAGTYRPVVVVGDMAYVSGHGPLKPDKTLVTGRVGADLTEQQGREAARVVGLAVLATLKSHFGTLDRIARTVKVLGMVNAASDFQNHPSVINGFSDLMAEVFGEDGIGARSAVGMGSLPGNITVEVEAIFQLKPAE
ncbi:MAG: RidA family protein [Planctomycetaceae bacterium]|nr:RidA family protein [Planctomycetaceae bacterium]